MGPAQSFCGYPSGSDILTDHHVIYQLRYLTVDNAAGILDEMLGGLQLRIIKDPVGGRLILSGVQPKLDAARQRRKAAREASRPAG